MELDLWSIERAHYAQGCKVICGVDEAGRGPLAGPVCAAAVILPPDLEIPGLNDSKKLSDAKRRALFDVITEQAVAYGICMVDEKRIDEINILQATFEAMQGALDQLTVRPELGADRRQSGAGLWPAGRDGHRRRRQECQYRGGVHPGQGHPGPVYGAAGGALSPVRL